jgi:hypothetical protein
MNEQELRLLVREAIARHLGGAGTIAPSQPRTVEPVHHFSHGLFVVPSGGDSEGPCIIEPSVMCNHCGYCKSYGH